jgi:hypothetical protein
VTAPIVQVPGNLSGFGLSKETTPGTPVLPVQFEPFTTCNIIPETGLFFPPVMMGVRETDVFALYGQEKLAGPVDGPLFPVNGISLFVGAIGTDNAQSGTLGSTKNGTITAAAKGATSLTYAVVGGGAPVANEYIQIGPAVATLGLSAIPFSGGPAGTQVVKITSVAGTTSPYTLTVPALQFKVDTVGNGAAGLVAQNVVAPFYHNVAPANTLNSYTIEKNLGGKQSEQYAGCQIDSYNLKCPTTNSEVSFSAAVMGLAVATLSSPTAVAVDSGNPFVFAEGSLSFQGNVMTTATNVEIDIQNTIKDTYTVGTSHLPTYLTATTRKFSAKCTAVFSSLTDAAWGYFTQAFPSIAPSSTPVVGALSLTLTHPSGGGIIGINFPQVNIDKIGDDVKVGDVITQSLDLTPSYDISLGYAIQAYVANNAWSAY